MTTTKTAPGKTPVEKPEVVRVERLLPHPPRRVWRALTAKDAIEKWLFPLSSAKDRKGGKDSSPDTDTLLETPGESVILRASPIVRIAYEVAEADPERYLSLWWRVRSLEAETDETMTTRVTWTLTPEQDGAATRLVIEHTPFGVTALTSSYGSAPLNGAMARLAVYLGFVSGRTSRNAGARRVGQCVKEKIRCQ